MTAIDTRIDELKRAACAAVDALAPRLIAMSREIHAHPELAFNEHHANAQLVQFATSSGFAVQDRVYGLDTAFRGEWGKGPVTIAICAEMDALPGIGHACGHNLIATCGAGAAAALVAALEPSDARIVLLGTPAEENGGGKIRMLKAGCFDDVDVAMMAHPAGGSADIAEPVMLGGYGADVTYIGRAAHAGSAPERGLNALDALVTAYVTLGQLRQHIRRDERIHMIITEGGVAPNIIPERAAGRVGFRALRMERIGYLKDRVEACLNGAAEASGCEVRIAWREYGLDPLRSNSALAAAYQRNGEQAGKTFAPWQDRFLGGGTDMGNVSRVVPAIHPSFGVGARATVHTADFTPAAVTDDAHAAMLATARALAMTAVDVALDDHLLAAVREEFTRA
jgi:amidohydrolase